MLPRRELHAKRNAGALVQGGGWSDYRNIGLRNSGQRFESTGSKGVGEFIYGYSEVWAFEDDRRVSLNKHGSRFRGLSFRAA